MHLPYTTLSNNSIRFDIETLSAPSNLLEEKSLQQLATILCPKLEALTEGKQTLVDGGYHAFLYGLYKAYSEHRPFTLSPDMLWLLVLQGFSGFINANAFKDPTLFPQLKTRQTIVVQNDSIRLGDPDSPWEETTEQLTDAVEEILGDDFVALLRADFSTTQLAERVASEVTILDAMKPYFKYIVYSCVCGIPSITLEGNTEDWDNMLQKMEGLKQHHLDWWMTDLIPIVTQIKQSAAGNIDQEFWRGIFKIHSHEDYGNPKTIDGWITRFFPFDRTGNRWNMWEQKRLSIESLLEELPKQLVQVPFKYQIRGSDAKTVLEEHSMEYWAGFVGVEQDAATFGLRPKIHWWVAHANTQMEQVGKGAADYADGKAFYNLEKIPAEIFEKKEWESLSLHFKDKIVFPLHFAQLKVRHLSLYGSLSMVEKMKLKAFLLGKEVWVEHNDEPLFH